jgi:hypothetical protein
VGAERRHSYSTSADQQHCRRDFLNRTAYGHVVKPGEFEFLDQFDLSHATARVQDGTLIVVQGVNIRDQVRGQSKVVDIFLQWRQSIQALEIVAANS